jgi:uncharacterized membrane protein
MLDTVIAWLLWFCALGCALMGGVYFAFSAFIMKSLEKAGHAGITAMNSINAVILKSLFMPVFFGTTLGCGALVILGMLRLDDARSPWLIAGGAVYIAGMFLVTLMFNVPLNNALAAIGPESRTGNAIWKDYRGRWTRWNHLRTVSCMLAAAAFIHALR